MQLDEALQLGIAIGFVIIALILFVVWRKKKLGNEALNALAAIGGIVAGLAAIVLFIFPALISLTTPKQVQIDATSQSNDPTPEASEVFIERWLMSATCKNGQPDSSTYIPKPVIPMPKDIWQILYYQLDDESRPYIYNLVGQIGFDWGENGPGYCISPYKFGAVFSGTFYFPGSPNILNDFEFYLKMDGTARIEIDGTPVAYEENAKKDSLKQFSKSLTEGLHSFKVSYYSNDGQSSIRFYWTPAKPSVWLGRYYDNPSFAGSPMMIRKDSDLWFLWDKSPIEGASTDNLSVQWITIFDVPPEGNLCSMVTNGKVRVYIDGETISDLSNWETPNDWTGKVKLNKGKHLVEVYFVKGRGKSEIHFTCQSPLPI